MVILWFFDVLGEEKTWFLPHETVSSIFFSFFVNYVAMSIFCLGGKSFNEDRNYHQYTIGIALIFWDAGYIISYCTYYIFWDAAKPRADLLVGQCTDRGEWRCNS